MFIVLGIIILGILIGTRIKSERAPKLFSQILTATIHLLLLVMGVCVGSNELIMGNLSTIGLRALIITLGSLVGSCLLAAIVYHKVFKKREESR